MTEVGPGVRREVLQGYHKGTPWVPPWGGPGAAWPSVIAWTSVGARVIHGPPVAS